MRAALVKDHQLLSINPCRGPSRSVKAKIIYFLRLLKDYFWLALPVLLRCDRLEGERGESDWERWEEQTKTNNYFITPQLSHNPVN